jgi:DNA polymerase III epsilon subunit-like protein
MKLLKLENINNIMFIDIETAPQWETLTETPADVRKEWVYKFKFAEGAPKKPTEKDNPGTFEHLTKKYNEYFSNLWESKAGLFPEFSKVICISAGYMDGYNFKLKSYSQENEADLLKRFAEDLTAFNNFNKYLKLCAHYGKGFDYPFLAKRLLIHRQKLPYLLDNYGLKPWESTNLDTQEIWKIGSFGGSGTLSAIAMAFGIPSPKDDIEGADVAAAYYRGELARIVVYCDKDVFTLLNVFKAMRGEELLDFGAVQKVI